jgi:hypothetical protein
MDYAWMRERLEQFQSLCEAYQIEHRKLGDYNEVQRQLSAAMTGEMPTVKEVLKRLDADLVPLIKQPEYIGGASDGLRAAQQGLGILRDREEWATRLVPDAPSLVADRFHPNIWHAVSDLWPTGKYRVAVGQGAAALSSLIQAKSGLPLTERALVTQVFAAGDPTEKTPIRLHVPGDHSSDTWRSRQEGLHLIAQGAFAGIRNVSTHTSEEWSEQTALEHLAVLSVVARWTDETEVGLFTASS